MNKRFTSAKSALGPKSHFRPRVPCTLEHVHQPSCCTWASPYLSGAAKEAFPLLSSSPLCRAEHPVHVDIQVRLVGIRGIYNGAVHHLTRPLLCHIRLLKSHPCSQYANNILSRFLDQIISTTLFLTQKPLESQPLAQLTPSGAES